MLHINRSFIWVLELCNIFSEYREIGINAYPNTYGGPCMYERKFLDDGKTWSRKHLAQKIWDIVQGLLSLQNLPLDDLLSPF